MLIAIDLHKASRVGAFLLRVSFVYWILWGIPWALQQFARFTNTPGMGVRYWALWNPLTGWTGEKILRFSERAVYTDLGSGDSPFSWTLLIVQLATAGVIAAAWTAFAPGGEQDRKLNAALTLGLRFLFALVLIEYGAAKLVPTQFPPPRIEVLATPLGDLPPHQLLWAFMGASPLYNYLAGAVEMAAGALLLFRRTAMVGALLGIAAMTNVLALNLAYDVSVKLFLLHLILMGVWIVAPAAPRMARALRPPRPAPSARARPAYGAIASLAVLLVAGGLSLTQNAQGRRTYGDLAPKPPLYGRYRVASDQPIEASLPPVWRFAELIIPAHRGPAQVRFPDGRVARFRLEIDTLSRKVVARAQAQPGAAVVTDTFSYSYTTIGVDVVGHVGSWPVNVHLRRVNSDTLPLFRQKLRWVQ